ncbi:MAG: hypothetical protein C4519_20435 [Desulfobacteraceae bacterium]|nr:MAG: hypothetical protein C4519_20435 [Desulfobacteraceae bacterium]
MDSIEIEYCFQMQGEEQRESFKVSIEAKSLQAVCSYGNKMPSWTALEFHQCPNCPLKKGPHCPAAVNMVGLVECFDRLLSYGETVVTVTTAERLVRSDTSMQRGICSLMGLMMASSGCPLTAFFKPMARFHLPFASTEETIWRATSTYLMAQYFRHQMGSPTDVSFQGLSALYRQVQIVNSAFAKRLRAACRRDSMINAIVLLDMFAKSMPYAIEDSLDQIRELFIPYLTHTSSI